MSWYRINDVGSCGIVLAQAAVDLDELFGGRAVDCPRNSTAFTHRKDGQVSSQCERKRADGRAGTPRSGLLIRCRAAMTQVCRKYPSPTCSVAGPESESGQPS